MLSTLEVKTSARNQFIDITAHVKSLVKKNQISSGVVIVFVPHTTCGVTINENADPDVREDMVATLGRLVPDDGSYRHVEGNADAHIKASLIGSSVQVFVESHTLVLGTWQGIFLAEFDGPRQRSVVIKVIPD